MEMSKLLNKMAIAFGTYRHAYSAIRTQFNPQQISTVRNAKLRTLIKYCFNNIKYYRELFEQTGVVPEQISTVEDLQKLPILTRKELRDRFWDFFKPLL